MKALADDDGIAAVGHSVLAKGNDRALQMGDIRRVHHGRVVIHPLDGDDCVTGL